MKCLNQLGDHSNLKPQPKRNEKHPALANGGKKTEVSSTNDMMDYGDRQEPLCHKTMPVVLVLDRLRSAFNTGNIFRLADAVRAQSVITCGYTPSPPHAKLAKTARGTEQIVHSETAESSAAAVQDLKHKGLTVYAVEITEKAQSIWDTTIKFPAAFVLGNEALGVTPDVLTLCDEAIALPCLGVKHSINVGNCAAVVLYEALRQWQGRLFPDDGV
ncbi:MAG: TrmH family RNA methyltransferase [Lentisphaeria bacterium]